MKKMPCLFKRDFADERSPVLLREVTPGCEWVLRGEGVASRKWDGTACAVIDGQLYKRYAAKRDRKTGEYRLPPSGAVPCCDPDPTTGHWPHWVPVSCNEPADKHHVAPKLLAVRYSTEEIEAIAERGEPDDWLPDGTYELIGPPIGGNPEGVLTLELHRHGDVVVAAIAPVADHEGVTTADCVFDYLRALLTVHPWEGLVFAHADGRMCKIRRADFGLPWPVREA